VEYKVLHLLSQGINILAMRILCLDMGSKRIGCAMSDPFGWTAQALEVIVRHNNEQAFNRIIELCTIHNIEHIVVGLPLDDDNGIGDQAQKILGLSNRLHNLLLKNNLTIPIEMWDERFSTAEAEAHLIQQNVSRQKRRKIIDKMAASFILQRYLEAKDENMDHNI